MVCLIRRYEKVRGKIGILLLLIFLLAIFIAPSWYFIKQHMQELKDVTKDQQETDEIINLVDLGGVNYEIKDGVLTISAVSNNKGKLDANSIVKLKKSKKSKKKVTNKEISSAPWGEESEKIYKVVIKEGHTIFLDPSATGLFYNCKYCKSMDLRGIDTRFCVNMDRMFEGCSNLEELDVEGWNTDKLVSLKDMFKGCDKLTKVKGVGEKINTAFKSK